MVLGSEDASYLALPPPPFVRPLHSFLPSSAQKTAAAQEKKGCHGLHCTGVDVTGCTVFMYALFSLLLYACRLIILAFVMLAIVII